MHKLEDKLASKFPFLHKNPLEPPPLPLHSKPRPAASSDLGENIFKPFSNDPPPIPSRPDHPVPRSAIRARTIPVYDTHLRPLGPVGNSPLQTNKFYANLFLGSQSCPAWTQPYSVWWSQGRGNCQSWGMSITHIDRSGIAFGPQNDLHACNYFFGPIGTIDSHSSIDASNFRRHTTYVFQCSRIGTKY
jgi:endoglucanase Acf2